MVKIYYEKANKIRKNLEDKQEDSNIRHLGDKVVLYQKKPISRATNEMIYSIDALNEEVRYFKEKFPHIAELIDYRAWENIIGVKRTISAIKYYYGMNYYKE